ncbi:hypothetical protein IQ274_28345 [Nostoc sp. LEGE 12447]|nr:hypothetical protein [Nostoc sp. LEGE 12447]
MHPIGVKLRKIDGCQLDHRQVDPTLPTFPATQPPKNQPPSLNPTDKTYAAIAAK